MTPTTATAKTATTKTTTLRRAAVGAVVAALGLVAAASPASAAPTDRTVAAAWCGDFLQRSLDAGCVERWAARSAAAGPLAALGELTSTREHAEHQVGLIYRKHLQRQPDPGAAYWVDGVAAGRFPLEWVEQNVLASQEYAGLWARVHRSTAPAVLAEAWINTLLDRRATAGERSYWGDRVRAVGRLGALRDLYYTQEGVHARINSHYRELLGRDVDGGGYYYWFGLETKDDLAVQVQVAASPEYRERSETR